MTFNFQHPSLGEIHGVQKDGIVQFLGIKYASLKDRFAKSEILGRGVEGSIIDGTKHG
jgi:hypothetical protein